jgi:hypothetical protein
VSQTIDAAAVAAKSIADATGLQGAEAAALALQNIVSRVAQLEAVLPNVQAAYDDLRALAAHVEQALPHGFVDRVEGFFARHFPAHAAPAVTADSTAKSE